MRRATLVLGGGGANGSWQAGVEAALARRGYRWERIFGVSVGALNGLILAQDRPGKLEDVWRSIGEADIYTKRAWPIVAMRVLAGSTGFYSNAVLRHTIERFAAGVPMPIEAWAGRTALVTGAFELVSNRHPNFLDAVWHSATMPAVWDAIGPRALADGGIRNMTPLGAALDHHPSEVVVIQCGPAYLSECQTPRNVLDAVKRALVDVALNEISTGDVDSFLLVNRLVLQAAEQGVTLRDEEGRPYRHVPITIVRPIDEVGDTLDFSRASIERRLQQGFEMGANVELPS